MDFISIISINQAKIKTVFLLFVVGSFLHFFSVVVLDGRGWGGGLHIAISDAIIQTFLMSDTNTKEPD